MQHVLSTAEYAAYADWCRHYWALARYVAATGELPEAEALYERLELGSWVAAQRAAELAGTLTPDQRLVLNALPAWRGGGDRDDCGDDFGSEWWQQAAALARGQPADGTASPLARWVAVQRADYCELQMPETRAALLRAVPGWKWSNCGRAAKWWASRDLLAEYVAVHGSLPTQRAVYRGWKVGRWLYYQRSFREGVAVGSSAAPSEMSPERRAALEAIPGWSWTSLGTEWEKSYAALVEYVDAVGQLPSLCVVHNGFKLGPWVHRQREAYRATQKPRDAPARERKLEAVAGWTWLTDQEVSWRRMYEQLVEHVDTHRELPASLRQWVHYQRLSREHLHWAQRALLDAVPDWQW